MEVEPNDRASAAMGAPSVFVRGALGRFDIDCYAIDVPAGGGVYAHAVNANGQCTGNTVLDLYDPAGRWLGSDADAGPSGCPRVDGALYSWARGLAQGVYSVCLREANNGIVSAYALSATRQEP
jgi:hypothetical protein